ncbi:MAG TPA: hypothetical protein VFF21_03170 [Flavobacteriaceae bacterium]|nr:hypothetical protein [Flavobacteriaceae bacterium]
MKRLISLSIVLLLLSACSSDDRRLNTNPFLTNPVVNLSLNLNLPEYNSLKFPGNYIIAPQGVKGIVIYCINENQYVAFDLADPNHAPIECSRMSVEGIIATCPCPNDENEYFIITGQHKTDPDTKYPMQPYRAQRSGNYVTVRN